MKLTEYSTGKSGGMLGGYSSTRISCTDDGRCKVEISEKVAHNQPVKHVTYYAEGLLDNLSTVCERYNVISRTDLTGEKMVMLDAPSGSSTFTFENGTRVVLDSNTIYPEDVWELYQDFAALIKDSEKYGTDMQVTEEEQTMAMGMGMMGTTFMSNLKVQDVNNQNKPSSGPALFCAECGTKFEGDQRFCTNCGAVRK